MSSNTCSCECKTAYEDVHLKSMLPRLWSLSPWHEMMQTDAKASVGTHALCCHETPTLTAQGCTCVKDCHLQSAVATSDCRGLRPFWQSVEEGRDASCHGCAHCRATTANLQKHCYQKGSEAAVSITCSRQTGGVMTVSVPEHECRHACACA